MHFELYTLERTKDLISIVRLCVKPIQSDWHNLYRQLLTRIAGHTRNTRRT